MGTNVWALYIVETQRTTAERIKQKENLFWTLVLGLGLSPRGSLASSPLLNGRNCEAAKSRTFKTKFGCTCYATIPGKWNNVAAPCQLMLMMKRFTSHELFPIRVGWASASIVIPEHWSHSHISIRGAIGFASCLSRCVCLMKSAILVCRQRDYQASGGTETGAATQLSPRLFSSWTKTGHQSLVLCWKRQKSAHSERRVTLQDVLALWCSLRES
ncbi:hypothetical protein QBC40DRAFT_87629 [Triangularia verruculosa]|uniref:Uncharacterized protein n=1 Tax=Triangularia verruculosa TaxID=2587418 RepID=A0AAN6XGH3_9PEZI|nr:hypothetical protein QBC40DRAFT_87629 [Triangularia verruculosa]